MKRIFAILSVILLLSGCGDHLPDEEKMGENQPTLSADHISMRVGETKQVEIIGADRRTLADIKLFGGENFIETAVSNGVVSIKGISPGETNLRVKPGGYPELTLKVEVMPVYDPEDLFKDQTPRFESEDIYIDCNKPGVLVYRIHNPGQWVVRDLNNGDAVTVNDEYLTINNTRHEIKSLEIFDKESESVNFIRITLKNNQEGWLVVRKE